MSGGEGRLTIVALRRWRLLRLAALLGFFLVLVVIPRTDRRVDEASKEEEETDKQDDTDHSTVKSVPFSKAGNLAHKGVL